MGMLMVGSIMAGATMIFNQWRNYVRRSEAIASGRQAAGGALSRQIMFFALQLNFERQKEVKRTNKIRMWAYAQRDGRPT